MKILLQLFAVTVSLYYFTCYAADDEFYHNYQTIMKTNLSPYYPIRSPLLIDTNNIKSKLTNALLQLGEIKSTGVFCGLRLGMTMGETVSVWGKPRGGYSKCLHGLTTFGYGEISLAFEDDSLETVLLQPSTFSTRHEFGNGLRPESKVDDFLHVLGEPTSRTDDLQHGTRLVYASPKAAIALDFHEGELMTILIERSVKWLEPKR